MRLTKTNLRLTQKDLVEGGVKLKGYRGTWHLVGITELYKVIWCTWEHDYYGTDIYLVLSDDEFNVIDDLYAPEEEVIHRYIEDLLLKARMDTSDPYWNEEDVAGIHEARKWLLRHDIGVKTFPHE